MGTFSKVLRKTYISLIPKREKPKKHFTIDQSVFLMNHTNLSLICLLVDYAWYTSQTHLPIQGAFIPNRDIHHYILVAHETLSSISKKPSKKRDL